MVEGYIYKFFRPTDDITNSSDVNLGTVVSHFLEAEDNIARARARIFR